MPASITYQSGHFAWTISTQKIQAQSLSEEEVWLFRGVEAIPKTPVTEGVDEGWTKVKRQRKDRKNIVALLEKEIASSFNRTPGRVTIGRTASGGIAFSGAGLLGRTVNTNLLAQMTERAMEQNVEFIELPVEFHQPSITIEDASLREKGIQEVLAVGESSFTGSPKNRRHNIRVGIDHFNGHIIPQGETFSFVKILGPVNATTGYKKELVIQGDKTIPDFGGGLCQVSSTAYRGAWEYGLPIIKRKNHSYAVGYYSPQGTDATIYPPNVDLQFKNDTAGDILIQSFIDEKDRAYFIYYGTRDHRRVSLFGPFVSRVTPAPKEEKIVYSTDLAPGERRKNGERHDGKDVTWYREVQGSPTLPVKIETVFSSYEARPLFYEIGVTPEEMSALTEEHVKVQPN